MTPLTILLLAVLACIFAASSQGSRNHAFIGYTERKGAGQEPRVKISSKYGDFVVRLRPDLAPKSVELIVELAKKESCPHCNFYRHEPTPNNWGENGFYGPPYALLQGSLQDLSQEPPFENEHKALVERGHVCIIPACKEFFIATAAHPEWDGSHTIIGEVEDLSAEPKHPFEPFHVIKNGDIVTRWLNQSFPFTLSMMEPAAATA